jgi:hypothetical protein
VVTADDIERCLWAYGAQQGRDATREDFERWAGQLQKRGLGDVPLTLGSASARAVDQMLTDWLVKHRPTPEIRQRSHDMHDTMPELRKYKGRR